MFRKGKSGADKPAANADADDALSAPPLKPFSRTGSHVPGKPSRPAANPTPPSAPARSLDIPGLSGRRGENGQRGGGPADCLTVGRDIRLSGEVQCDRLVIDGQADLRVDGARLLEVSEGGRFSGTARVREADIRGRFSGTARVREADIRGQFDGELEATETLIVREHGRVSGKIRYGRIVIESGGEIRGETDTIAQPAAPAPADED